MKNNEDMSVGRGPRWSPWVPRGSRGVPQGSLEVPWRSLWEIPHIFTLGDI